MICIFKKRINYSETSNLTEMGIFIGKKEPSIDNLQLVRS